MILALLLFSGGASLAMLSFAMSVPSSTTARDVIQRLPVTVTEFSDFQCPYCKRAANVVEQVRQTYRDRVKIVFKQMPLRMHQYAFEAAQASVCAQQQRRFWEYHDRLFAANDLSPEGLNRLAAEVGLKQSAFNQCMTSDSSRTVVEKDIAEAKRLGVRGTPTFFINGTPLNGAASFAALKQEIDDAMLGLPHPVAKTVGDPSDVWHAAPKNGVGTTLALIQQSAFTPIANQPQQAASTTTADGVTLSPASINFGYQLVGTTGPQFIETVTNSGTAPLIITDISVSGRDHKNFLPTYNFTLPVTVAPGQSIAINLSFTPSLPWRAGTRNATLEISEKKSSQYVPLTGIGATCLGPVPACSSGCPDSSGDGLNDAWKTAGGIDIDNDGVIDASTGDVLLPGADPSKLNIYLKYDYMVSATHSYQPPANAFDQMTAMFAAHGIVLHVSAPAAGIPWHQVTTLDPNATADCAGADFITMQQLREQYLGNLRYAYHYMVFAHDSTTPHDGTLVANCPNDALCGVRPTPGASGVSDLPGNDSIISFGEFVDAGTQIGIEFWASTMMHELGHNFGLVHGSLADQSSQQECLIKKPNYISVMNYTYQTGGIIPNGTPGTPITGISCTVDADCGPPNVTSGKCATPNSCFCTDDGGPSNNFCYRPDYAEDDFINLNETTLDENIGVGGPPSDDDIVFYWNAGNALPGPSNGSPIDWNNDGAIENLVGCTTKVGPPFPLPYCPDTDDNGNDTDPMDATADWTQINGQFIHFNFQFQCTAAFQNGPGAPASGPELSFEWVRQHHMLHPPRIASISVSPGCSSTVKPITAGRPGTVRVAVLGSNNFDVSQIDPSSLKLHGANALSVTTKDLTGNGKLDLVATFDTSALKLHPHATVARLTGWLQNGGSFIGQDKIRVVSSLMSEDPSCR